MPINLFQSSIFPVFRLLFVHSSVRVIFTFYVHYPVRIISAQNRILNNFKLVFGHFFDNMHKFIFSFLSHIPVFLLFVRLL